MNIVVILPTYNEKDNIILIIKALQEQFRHIPHDMKILVVDDHSPDGTADQVKAECKTSPNVFLITGQKQGLGAAYIRGMKYAIDHLYADIVMEMDSDFSHKPKDVPLLIQAIDQGADFVIGSRYVAGGKIPMNWGLLRRMISKWGNIFARYIAGMHKVRDCTAGFRAIRSSLIAKIDLDNLMVQGYAFQITLLHHAIIEGAHVREVPVEFVDRERGQSKLGYSDIIEFMLQTLRIRFGQSKTFLRFLVVGATGVFVNLVVFTALMNIGLHKFIASPVAIQISIITNFLFNNFWTFAHRETGSNIHIRGLKFNIISIVSLTVSYCTFLLFSILDPVGRPQIYQVIAIVPATFTNYFLNSYFTFKDKKRSKL
jgi:dolichol-phosphate mannosyltransferase